MSLLNSYFVVTGSRSSFFQIYWIHIESFQTSFISKIFKKKYISEPESVFSLMASDLTPPCIALKWTVSPDSGADAYLIQYYNSEQETNSSKTTVSSLSTSAQLCEGIVAGTSLIFSVQAKKNDILSEPTVIEHTIKPLSPADFRVGVLWTKIAKLTLAVKSTPFILLIKFYHKTSLSVNKTSTRKSRGYIVSNFKVKILWYYLNRIQK